MCFASGAERKRLPWWRTIRVMTTTRRPGERERQRQRGPPAPPEGRSALGSAGPPEGLAGVAGLLRGAHHFADKALRTLGALVAVADAAWPEMEVVVACRSWQPALSETGATALGALNSLGFVVQAPAGPLVQCLNNPTQPTTCARPRSALLSCRPLVVFPCTPCPTLKPTPRPARPR